MTRNLPAALALAALATPAAAYDFSEVTTLARRAVLGLNVPEAVPGFEIRLLEDGVPVYHQAFGDWSLDRVAAMDSSTKTLSGALMVSLAETGDGGFSLDSRLADFLPSFDRPGYRDITVRHAFSHTSGLPGSDAEAPILAAEGITLQQAAALVSLQPLENGPPGSAFAYGGLSMQAAGAAAEIASGMAYTDLFAERISGPLGMTSTRFALASETNPRVAGGVESTATDIARFMDTLLNDGVDRESGEQVLSADSVAQMLTRQTDDSQTIVNTPTDDNHYGIGVWLDQLEQAGPPVDALAGGARGFHAWIDRSEGLVLTFATDQTRFSNVEQLSSRLHAAVLRAIAVPEPSSVPLAMIAAGVALAARRGSEGRS